MTTRTSCRTQRDWVSFGTLERRGKVSLSSPSFQLFKPINSRKLSLMKSLFSMSTDPSPSFFLLKSFHQKCARAILLPNGALMLTIVMKQYHSLFRFQTSLVSDTHRRSTFLTCHSERSLLSCSSRRGQGRRGNKARRLRLDV